MSESGDYEPAAHWKGYDFNSARAAYKDVIDRSYDDAVAKKVSVVDCVPETLETDSEAPLVIACDITGSMDKWPQTIFSKLPYLEHEGKEYLGEGMQIAFCAIGDVFSDKYPVQVRPFVSGIGLKESLEKLIIEGGGGGSSQESYDMMALYLSEHCKMPQAIRKPIMIFIGDEGVYSYVDNSHAKTWARTDLKDKVTPESVFEKLKEKFSVYIVRKPYQCNSNNPGTAEKRIQEQWCALLGADHVVSLPSADRVVDVIFGILAKETDRVNYFEKELKDRQLPDKDGDEKVSVVLKSLHSIHKIGKDASLKKIDGPKGGRAKSISKKVGGAKSISLLDDDDADADKDPLS